MHVEWAKAGARADRCEEEVVMSDEEMRQVLQFCNWKAGWWREQGDRRANLLQGRPSLIKGLSAYAAEQAHLEEMIAKQWEEKWCGVRGRARSVIALVMGMALEDGGNQSNDEVEVELELDEMVELDEPQDVYE